MKINKNNAIKPQKSVIQEDNLPDGYNIRLTQGTVPISRQEILGYPKRQTQCVRAPVKKSHQNNEEGHCGKDHI